MFYKSYFKYLFLIIIVILLVFCLGAVKNKVGANSGRLFLASEINIWDNLSQQLEKARDSLKSLLNEISGKQEFLTVPKENQKESVSESPAPSPALSNKKESAEYEGVTEHEKTIINIVKKSMPAVVSIVIYKDMPLYEQYLSDNSDLFKDIPPEFQPFFEFKIPQYRQKGTQKIQIGGGSGFIIKSHGLILTNKHVASMDGAEYAVVLNNGKEYKAKVIAKDPVQDLAVLQINASNLSILDLGDSDKNVIGQTVIAIGNALGEFRNTVSVGVISGLGRSVKATGGAASEIIEGAIQTDAAINQGNSGGPLLNLRGEVIGINTAMAFGAENIGFAIPINKAKKAIYSIETKGKISTPYLGVRYQIIDSALKEKNNLPVDYGAWIHKGANGEPAIEPSSAAEKAGLKEGDIILEVNGKKINKDNTLASLIQGYNVGDEINLKIIRGDKIIDLKVILGEM